jgi:hypothetical protein
MLEMCDDGENEGASASYLHDMSTLRRPATASGHGEPPRFETSHLSDAI